MTLCDSCDTAVEPTANYCPECGTELHPRMKDWSDGFLSLVDRGHIQEAIDGNETLPEGYHERLHATVRHALSDFCLLDRWEEFDNYEALFGDFPDETDVEDWDELQKAARLTCPFRFILSAGGIERFEAILRVSLLFHTEDADFDDISVSIDIDDPGE